MPTCRSSLSLRANARRKPSGSGTLRGASTAIFNSRPRYHNLRSVLLPPFTASELKVHRGRSPCRRAFSPGKCQSQSQNSGQADLEPQGRSTCTYCPEPELSESGGPRHRGWKWGLEAEAGGEGGVSLGRSSREAAKVSPHGALGPEKGYVEGFFRGILASGHTASPSPGRGPPCSPGSLEEGVLGEELSRVPRAEGRVLRSVPTGPQTENSCCPPQARHSSHPVADRPEGRCSPYGGWTCYYGISKCTQTRKNRTVNVSLP